MAGGGEVSEQPKFIVSPGNGNGTHNGSGNHFRERLIDRVETDQIVVSDVSLEFTAFAYLSSSYIDVLVCGSIVILSHDLFQM